MKCGDDPKYVSRRTSSYRRCFVKKVFLKISQNSQENTCVRVFLIKLQQACNFIKKEILTQVFSCCNFIKKEILAQVFSCEFYEIFKNTFFIEHLWWLLLKKEEKLFFCIPERTIPKTYKEKIKLSPTWIPLTSFPWFSSPILLIIFGICR